MRLKARLTRLEAGMRWMLTDGIPNWAEAWLDIFEKKKQLEEHLASHPEMAQKFREWGYGEVVRLPPEPAPRDVAGSARVPSSVVPAEDEGPRHWRGAPPAMTPEDLQLPPVQSRRRTVEDDWYDDHDTGPGPGRALTEYDVLAED